MAAPVSRLRSYVVACVAVAIVTGLKLTVSDLLGHDAPVALLGLAIVGAGAVGGARSAFAASVLATVTGWYFFLPPRYSFALGSDAPTLIRTAALFAEGLTISAIVARLETARSQAEQVAGRLDRLQSLTSALAAAATPEDVARITVQKGVETLNATGGVFVQARFNGELEVIAQHGVESHVSSLTALSPSAVHPTARMGRDGRRLCTALSRLQQRLQGRSCGRCGTAAERGRTRLGCDRVSFRPCTQVQRGRARAHADARKPSSPSLRTFAAVC
jgi:K+-sensing histidine kinase KdpD